MPGNEINRYIPSPNNSSPLGKAQKRLLPMRDTYYYPQATVAKIG